MPVWYERISQHLKLQIQDYTHTHTHIYIYIYRNYSYISDSSTSADTTALFNSFWPNDVSGNMGQGQHCSGNDLFNRDWRMGLSTHPCPFCNSDSTKPSLNWEHGWLITFHWFMGMHRKTSSISRTKSQSLNESCILAQLSLLNPLNPGVKLRMKM